jgi:predicted ATPase/DNA-binding XRE family transcriptional regulator
VRRRRKALDLLQKELAGRVGCSVAALQKIERDERRPSRALAERLAESLDVPASQRAAFVQVARGERMAERLASLPEPPAPAIVAERPLPLAQRELVFPAGALIGREAELAEITQLLRDPYCRLLTLIGPGGIGKTRLALAAAQQSQASGQAVVFVALAPLVGREQVVTAIADALGCVLYGAGDRADQLAHYLRGKPALLLLDSFEHLLAEASSAQLVGQLLRATGDLKLMITSREPLDIQEEWVFDVQGLPLPASAAAGDVQASSAARLFQQRARQARAGYSLGADDYPAVVRICQLVGGAPLGIELAATWMRTLTCQEIAGEIQRNLDFLATRARDVPERHRSIRAVFDQSWALLSAEEQAVLRRLAVFRGGFTRAAAEQVAGASLALLAALVSKSLLRRTAAGRYDPHELVRQYALDRLSADEQEQVQTRGRQSRYYAALLQQRGAAFKGPDQVAVAAELAAELANIRLAWEWASTRGLAAELSQAADTLFWLYEAQSNFREGIPLFGQAVEGLEAPARAEAAAQPERLRQLALGQALSYQGFFCFRQGQHPLSRELLQRSMGLLGQLAGDGSPEARAALSTSAAFLGIVTYRMGEYAEGRRLLGQALAIKRELGDSWGAALCLRQLGLAAYSQGGYAEAHGLLSESLALSRAMGNPWSLAFSLNFLSMAAQAQGAFDEAQRLLQEGLALAERLQDRFNIASAQNGLGMVYLASGQAGQARRCFEQSIATWREIGDHGSLAQSLNQLGETLLQLHDRAAARDCFAEALAVGREAMIAPVMLDALLGLAAIYAAEGALEGALELALHILQNPASTQAARRRAEQLRVALEPQLAPDRLEALNARAGGVLSALAIPEYVAALGFPAG